MKSETDIKNEIRLALSEHGMICFNRPTGKYYAKHGNAYTPVKINVNGASDLQGHRHEDGRCFYIECKTPAEYAALMSRIERNKLTAHDKDQINFINQMQNSGALAGFAYDTESALNIIGINI